MTAINGLILAGGKSSRMGRDKSLIAYHGKPQREHLFDLLTPFCKTVYLSCKSTETIPQQFNPLPDTFGIDTPLNGILSAFNFNPANAWLTVPVDMPFVNADTIKYLLHHRNPKKIATCFWDSDGKLPEPLLTLWEPHASGLLSGFYINNGFSPREFLVTHQAHCIASPNSNWLKNFNSVQEMNQYVDSLPGRF
ncbi:MAG: NTP transferase domain-containing protein [Cyclobacteriaceae bacterium]|nr:NTP transferase domain-containing protein [Cyclobacteriaceae bacterium]